MDDLRLSARGSRDLGVYRVESNQTKTIVYSVIMALLGFWFVWITKDKYDLSTSYRSAYGLGVLLFFVGGAGLVLSKKTALRFDPNVKILFVEWKGFWSSGKFTHPFSAISKVVVQRIGDRKNVSESYHLVILMKNGTRIYTERWAFDRDEIVEIAKDIAEIAGCDSSDLIDRDKGFYHPKIRESIFFGISLILAVIGWTIYYRIKIGPWCPAMWFGTAPPLFIMGLFLIFYLFMRRWKP